MRWRIWYADGSVVRSEECPVECAPVFGVLVITQEDADCGRLTVSQGDYYVWLGEPAGWRDVDFVGLVDYLQMPGWKRVLVGRIVSTPEYQAVAVRAELDDSLPERR